MSKSSLFAQDQELHAPSLMLDLMDAIFLLRIKAENECKTLSLLKLLHRYLSDRPLEDTKRDQQTPHF